MTAGVSRGAAQGAAVLALALALASGAVACGGTDAAAPVDQPQSPREPDEVGEGCGRAAATPPSDLAAGRTVARCATGAPAARPLAAPTALRVAVPPQRTEELAPVLLADAMGEFSAERLDVQLIDMATDEAVAALAAGEVDVVVGPLDAAVFDAVADGVGLRQVLGGVVARDPNETGRAQTGLWIRASAVEGNTWADLALQPIALAGGLGDAAAHPLKLVLEPAELSLNDVEVVRADGTEAAQMLLDDEVAGAWLDGGSWAPVAEADGYRLIVTLPASESIDGTVVAPRLVEADRAVGLAYVRAVIRTINTHLSGGYRHDDEVVGALSEATGLSRDELTAGTAPMFDWEIRAGTAERIETALIELGGTAYDHPQGEDALVDRTLADEAVGR